MKDKITPIFSKKQTQAFFERKHKLRHINLAIEYLGESSEGKDDRYHIISKAHGLCPYSLLMILLKVLHMCEQFNVMVPRQTTFSLKDHIDDNQPVLYKQFVALKEIVERHFEWVTITDETFDKEMASALVKYLPKVQLSKIAYSLGLDNYGIEGFIVRFLNRLSLHHKQYHVKYTDFLYVIQSESMYIKLLNKHLSQDDYDSDGTIKLSDDRQQLIVPKHIDERGFNLFKVSFNVDYMKQYGAVGDRYDTVIGRWLHLQSLKPSTELELVRTVNDFFNQSVHYQTDVQAWGVSDYWAVPFELLSKRSGDCEDYAIAKYITLRCLGIAASKLNLVYVVYKPANASHMVLEYGNGDNKIILDNINTLLCDVYDRQDLQPKIMFNDDCTMTVFADASNNWIVNQRYNQRLDLWNNVLRRL